jgi:hypothetical protein
MDLNTVATAHPLPLYDVLEQVHLTSELRATANVTTRLPHPSTIKMRLNLQITKFKIVCRALEFNGS